MGGLGVLAAPFAGADPLFRQQLAHRVPLNIIILKTKFYWLVVIEELPGLAIVRIHAQDFALL
jgi:hypothetical protein